MGYNASWASANASERGPFQDVKSCLNASSAQIVGINRSAHAVGTSEYDAYREEQTYRHFTTVMQVVILIGSLLVVFKKMGCGECCGLVVQHIVLSQWWVYTMIFCKVIKFLHKVFCSVTILSFPVINKNIYFGHAVVASIPVFAVTHVSDIYAISTCTGPWSYSIGHVAYVITYNLTTVILPVTVVFLFMILIRKALSTSQKKKVIIAALRTPQNTISIPYASQRESELHAMLLSMVIIFIFCSIPYMTMVVYHAVLDSSDTSVYLLLTAIWLPKISLLANPLLFLTVNKSVRKCLVGMILQLHRRYSRRNIVSSGSAGEANLDSHGRSGSQLLEMFHIGQQQIFKPTEGENEAKSVDSNDYQQEEIPTTSLDVEQAQIQRPVCPAVADSAAQIAPAFSTEAELAKEKYSTQLGFGPFELPPQWLSENRNGKKRLLPPLGNTPEELIQTKQPRGKSERKMSRNNKVSIFPKMDS
uniref:G protein-coupled receptor 176 n=1 Tax=Naja naja TaxID=35670 RepID=A0A8C6VDL7_NAJNA